MRIVTLLLLTLCCIGGARAQVINGQSTDDAAFAPRPPARWHSPESSGAVPDNETRDEPRERDLQYPRTRD